MPISHAFPQHSEASLGAMICDVLYAPLSSRWIHYWTEQKSGEGGLVWSVQCVFYPVYLVMMMVPLLEGFLKFKVLQSLPGRNTNNDIQLFSVFSSSGPTTSCLF